MNEQAEIAVTVLFIVVWTVSTLVSVLIGWAIGRQRGRGDAGAALGLLGPVGWIIAALLPEAGRKCPKCLAVVPDEASRCKHCGAEIEPLSLVRAREAGLLKVWYIFRADKPEGPFSMEQLRALRATGAVLDQTPCAKAGDKDWRQFETVL